MADQLTEEPEMGALFVDHISEAAAEELAIIRGKLSAVVASLEQAGSEYSQAWRMLLAGEAALDHAVAKLQHAKNTKHLAWQARQREAREFLILRAGGSGRVFKVIWTDLRVNGKHYRGLPGAGTEFRFTLERTATLSGGMYGQVARLNFLVEGEPTPCSAFTMALQQLHRAFLDGAIQEIDVRTPAEPAPRSGPALRLEELDQAVRRG